MKQRWDCEACGVGGDIVFSNHAGVYEVKWKIVDAHREASKESRCWATNGIDCVRVATPSNQDQGKC